MKIDVLDHGWVKLRNISGPTRRKDADYDADDVDPANVARKSFDQSDSGRVKEDDLRLNNYLVRKWHTTPIEHVVVWLEMKLPIFVARHFARHRTVSIDEVSGRYVQLPDEWYIPKLEDVQIQSSNKKQGGRRIDLSNSEEVAAAHVFRANLDNNCANSYKCYQAALQYNMAMEQARLFLHLNHYTHWIWKQDLHNLMHFLSRRDHKDAQIEDQYYAQAIIQLLTPVIPNLMELYHKYRRFD